MMPSLDLERFATLIADNVVSTFERDQDGAPFHPTVRVTVVSVLVLVRAHALTLAASFVGADVREVQPYGWHPISGRYRKPGDCHEGLPDDAPLDLVESQICAGEARRAE